MLFCRDRLHFYPRDVAKLLEIKRASSVAEQDSLRIPRGCKLYTTFNFIFLSSVRQCVDKTCASSKRKPLNGNARTRSFAHRVHVQKDVYLKYARMSRLYS